MFSINTFNGQIFKNGVLVPLDINDLDYLNYKEHVENNGEVLFFEEIDEAEQQRRNFEIQVQAEFNAYERRCEDGRKAYNQINAEFRVLKENGAIPQGFYDLISETLLPVRNEVLAGQWISALQKLESIGNTIIGVDLYNRLYNQISNYISENYK